MDIIDIIYNKGEYKNCTWYNKKTNKFCFYKVIEKKSYHPFYNIYYCEKCKNNKKPNDLLKILKDIENKNNNYEGLLKIKGTPILE